MNRQPDDVDRADVESLLVMSRVHLEASRDEADPTGAADPLPALAPTPTASAPVDAAATAFAHARSAHALLAQQNVLGDTRFAMPKRSLLRMSRLFTHRIVAAVQALAAAVEGLIGLQVQAQAAQVQAQAVHEQAQAVHEQAHAAAAQELVRIHNQTLDDFEVLANSLRAQVVSAEMASQDALDSLASSLLDSHQVSASVLDSRMAEFERERRQDRREIQRLRALVDGRALDSSPVADPGAQGSELTDAPVDDWTYVEFERRFRGSPQEIKERQLDALRFVAPLVGSPAPLLDLGCGRGEWLAVLRDAGISAYGVDSSAGMVADATALQLDARCEDALEHLGYVDESSLQAVSAFHFAEHVPLPFLTRVLDAALLALRPGGILLIETPNPTNLVVGSAAFYLDPTHLRQLHPDFLSFLVESRGFTDVEVHFVHPVVEEAILTSGDPDDERYGPRLSRLVESAEWALFGPQDYVLVARRGEAAA